MSKHPTGDWEDEAGARAATNVTQRGSWLWWKEYRDAYAAAAGLGDDIPVEPDAELQAYLNGLDEKVLALRASARAEQGA
jgi:hypothetical protein